MKRFVMFVITFFCVFACMSVNAKEIELYMFGKEIKTDVAPVIENGRTLVPVRAITESGMGADVSWNGKTREVTVVKDDLEIVFTIGEKKVFVNGDTTTLDVPAKLISDRTMIPVRFVGETLNYEVEWDDENRRVVIDKKSTSESIEDIEVEKTRNDNLLNITMSKLEKPSIFTLKEPYRIVLDFTKTKFQGHDDKIKVDSGYITEVRWANHDGYYRIVIECPGEQPYKYVKTGDESFSIIVGDRSTEVKDTDKKPEEPEKDDDSSPKEDEKPNRTPAKERETLVVIDAGHGGKDPGAVGKDEEGNEILDEDGEAVIKEKDINLAVAKMVYNNLKNKGISVMMTRKTDKFLELNEIAEIANEAEATLFVSIHSNSVDGVPTANGTEVLYFDNEDKEEYGISTKTIAKTLLEYMLDVVDMHDRGVRERPGLAVLKWTEMPAVLVELGFVTNAEDQEKLIAPDWQADAAWGISQGIAAVVKKMN